jgi:aconitase B
MWLVGFASTTGERPIRCPESVGVRLVEKFESKSDMQQE